jgi:hypothetical protein
VRLLLAPARDFTAQCIFAVVMNRRHQPEFDTAIVEDRKFSNLGH